MRKSIKHVEAMETIRHPVFFYSNAISKVSAKNILDNRSFICDCDKILLDKGLVGNMRRQGSLTISKLSSAISQCLIIH